MRLSLAAGKHLVLLTVGESEAGIRAARSHTGALVSDLAAIDAACRAAGIVRVSTPRELIDAAKALLEGSSSSCFSPNRQRDDSPRCQPIDGFGVKFASFWSRCARAQGGAALLVTEMTDVSADARITPGCAGIYTAHAGIELYAEAFDAAGALDKLEAFASFRGADFYGLQRNGERLTLVRRDSPVPEELSYGPNTLVPLRAGGIVPWSVI